MSKSLVVRFLAAAAIMSVSSVISQAQSGSQADTGTPSNKAKPASASHRVWTEDDISTVRKPADRFIDASDRQRQSENSTATAQDTPAKQPVGDASKPPVKKAPLSQAKSFEDAEAKIGWEQRDIQGQEEFIASLQQRLDSATPEEREHLQKVIEERRQIIADTRNELRGLEEQKKNFEKNPAAATSSTTPPGN